MFISTHGNISHSVRICLCSILIILKATDVQADSCSPLSNYCVCSYQFMKNALRRVIETSSPNSVISRLQSYKCQSYRAIPSVLTATMKEQTIRGQQNNEGSRRNNNYPRNFPQTSFGTAAADESQNLAPSVKDFHKDSRYDPRHIHKPHFGIRKKQNPNSNANSYRNYLSRNRRKKRQIADSMTTSQNMKLQNAITKLPSTASSHHTYTFLGHRAQLNCDMGSNQIDSLDTQYRWIHSNGNPISAPAASVNEISGELTIPAVQLSDIDVYNCTVSSSSSVVNPPTFASSHQLSVVTDSIHWLSITAYYVTRTCSVPDMNTIQSNLPNWISYYICPVCTVHDSSIFCDTTSGLSEEELNSNEYQIKFALTVFNLQNEILDGTINPQICTEMCSQALQLSLITIILESVKKLLALPIQFASGNGKMLTPKRDSISFELMIGCLAGFEFQYKICFPCLPGHYSLKGESECVECSHGFYQSSPGASSCLPCGKGEDTVEAGATNQFSCISSKAVEAYQSAKKHAIIAFILFILFLIFIIILLVLVCICFCCPQSKVGKFIRRCCPCLCNLCANKNSDSSLERRQNQVVLQNESISKRKSKKVTNQVEKEEETQSPNRKLPGAKPKNKVWAIENRRKMGNFSKSGEVVRSPPIIKISKSNIKYEQLDKTEATTSAATSATATTATEGSETESEPQTTRVVEPRKHALHHSDNHNAEKTLKTRATQSKDMERWKSGSRKVQKDERIEQHSFTRNNTPQRQAPTSRKSIEKGHIGSTLNNKREALSKHSQVEQLPSPYSANESRHPNPNVRVKDTVAKINAKSARNNQSQGNSTQRKIITSSSHQAQHYLPVYEKQTRGRENIKRKPGQKDDAGPRKTTRAEPHQLASMTSDEEEEEVQRFENSVEDSGWDRYCHRCAKASQKQPRYYPPPPPPVPPN